MPGGQYPSTSLLPSLDGKKVSVFQRVAHRESVLRVEYRGCLFVNLATCAKKSNALNWSCGCLTYIWPSTTFEPHFSIELEQEVVHAIANLGRQVEEGWRIRARRLRYWQRHNWCRQVGHDERCHYGEAASRRTWLEEGRGMCALKSPEQSCGWERR